MKIKLEACRTIAKCGDVFECGGVPYLLAQVGIGMCALISLDDGNREREAVPVKDIDAVSELEMAKMGGAQATFIGRLSITE